MTVAELIVELQKQPQDAEVVVELGKHEGHVKHVETVKNEARGFLTLLWIRMGYRNH